jgi:enamine deaminase RidA (YjgF/YER057c/UK114 family)
MPKQEIVSKNLAEPNGHFAQAVVAEATGRLLFISGMTARNTEGGITGLGDISAQTRQVCENVKAAVEAARRSTRCAASSSPAPRPLRRWSRSRSSAAPAMKSR